MKIALFWADNWSEWISSMWRVQFLHAGLVGAGVESRLYSVWELPRDGAAWHPVEDWAEYIIFERLPILHWRMFIDRWLSKGIKVFLTLDDAYHLMPDYLRQPPKFWADQRLVAALMDSLKIFDGVFVPSQGLADEVSKFGGRAYFIPNYPDLKHPAIQIALNSNIPHCDDRYTIGWGGSHHHSLSILLPVFKELIEENPRIQIRIVGNNAAFNDLQDIPTENKRHFPRMPYANYLMAIKQFDVFAIPLSGKYDLCRSWIKPLEAAMMGVPWVATDDRIYKDCQGGRLVRSKAQWKEALLSPVEPATDWAMQQGIHDHVEDYINVLLGSDTHLWRKRRRFNKQRTKKH